MAMNLTQEKLKEMLTKAEEAEACRVCRHCGTDSPGRELAIEGLAHLATILEDIMNDLKTQRETI